MSFIYLVRHGQKESLIGDPPLTEEGRIQAEKTAEFFATFPIDLVAASPMLRTKETATYIAQKKQLPLVTNPLLRERINWGDDPTQTMQEFLRDWMRSTADREWQPEYGDSSIAAGQRIESAIQELQAQAEQAVLVTHGGVISDFLRNVFGDDILLKHLPTFRFMRELSIKECSVTTLEVTPAGLNLVQVASCDHL